MPGKMTEEQTLLENNVDTIRWSLEEIEHHTSDLDGRVFAVQSSKGVTTRAALILRELNTVRDAAAKILANNRTSTNGELKAALVSAREWLTEVSPTGHDPRCQRLRDAGESSCRCLFERLSADLKKIDAVLEGTEP